MEQRLLQCRQRRLLLLVEAFEALGFGGEGVELVGDAQLLGDSGKINMRSFSDELEITGSAACLARLRRLLKFKRYVRKEPSNSQRKSTILKALSVSQIFQ